MRTITVQLEDEEIEELRESLLSKHRDLIMRAKVVEDQLTQLDATVRNGVAHSAIRVIPHSLEVEKNLNKHVRVKRGTAISVVKNTLLQHYTDVATTVYQIALRSGVSVATARRALYALEQTGTAQRTGSAWKAKELPATNGHEKSDPFL